MPDCIHVKVHDADAVRTKAVYLVTGVNMEGHKEVLGLWIAQTEGAKFWLQVVTMFANAKETWLANQAYDQKAPLAINVSHS